MRAILRTDALKPRQTLAMENLIEGVIVNHPTLGLGKILLRDQDKVWVYFKDIEGNPKDAIKALSLSVAKLSRSSVQVDQVLDNLPPMVHGGKVVPPDHVRLTEKQALDLFVKGFRSFEDKKYLERERNYKWDAHKETRARLLSAAGRRLVQADLKNELPKLLRDLIQATNLLAVQETIRLNDAFKVKGTAQSCAKSVLDFVDGPSAETFNALTDCIGGLPAEPGSNVLTWPIVTLLPFLADPKNHMFLKPLMTQRVADVFMFDLLYHSRPSWPTYQRLIQLSEILLNRLRPLGARDYIDVQSFMWIVEGSAYMKGKVQKAK